MAMHVWFFAQSFINGTKAARLNLFQGFMQFALCVVCACSIQFGALATRAAPSPSRNNPILSSEDDAVYIAMTFKMLPLGMVILFALWSNGLCLWLKCFTCSSTTVFVPRPQLVSNQRGLRLTITDESEANLLGHDFESVGVTVRTATLASSVSTDDDAAEDTMRTETLPTSVIVAGLAGRAAGSGGRS